MKTHDKIKEVLESHIVEFICDNNVIADGIDSDDIVTVATEIETLFAGDFRKVKCSERLPDKEDAYHIQSDEGELGAACFDPYTQSWELLTTHSKNVEYWLEPLTELTPDLSPNQPNSQPEPKYPIGGYAPGNYTCRCSTCGSLFVGDKRSVQCEPCAEKMVKSQPEPMGADEWLRQVSPSDNIGIRHDLTKYGLLNIVLSLLRQYANNIKS